MARETLSAGEGRHDIDASRSPIDSSIETAAPIQSNGDQGSHRDLWRTRNHSIIRFWVESRGGHPAIVENGDGPKCTIQFPERAGSADGAASRPISWGKFFEWFDERRLVMEYELKDMTGKRSCFNRLVQRTPMDEI